MKDWGPGKRAGEEGQGTRDKDCIIAPKQENTVIRLREKITQYI